jgi:mannose-6-phosphate isomerase-like protein (cupin superfamily)
MTFAYYEIAADAVPLHEHHHPQEEVWNVVQGSLAVTIDGEEQIAGSGCAAVVPADTRHSARAPLRLPGEQARHDAPHEHARARSRLAPSIHVEVDARDCARREPNLAPADERRHGL